MNRWTVRILGVALIIVFTLVMTMMYKQLVALQRAQQQSAPAKSR